MRLTPLAVAPVAFAVGMRTTSPGLTVTSSGVTSRAARHSPHVYFTGF